MGKAKGHTATGKQERIQKVIDLIVKYSCTNNQIKEALKTQEPNLSVKTIERAIAEARKAIRGLGSQSSEDERGLLAGRLEDLYATEKRKKDPNSHLINQVLRTSLSIYKTNPQLKKGGTMPHDETQPTPSITLSAELESALNRLSIFEPDAEPEHPSSST
jgi:hypothetical protein